MIIGVLSDTHSFFHPDLPAALSSVDVILHAGDVGTPEILDRLSDIAPTFAVYGNVDGREIRMRTDLELSRTIGHVRLLMTHIGGHPARWAPGILDRLRAERPDVFICGHSHILRIERVRSLNNMLYLNPGAAGRQGFHREKTCVLLHADNGKLKTAQVVHLDR